MKRLIFRFPIFAATILSINSYAELPHQFFFGHTGRVLAIAFSPDGKWIASGGGGANEIRIWDVATAGQIYTLNGHKGQITDLAFRANGDLASASVDGTVRLWDVPNQREIQVLAGHVGQVTSISFRPDGRRIASGSRDGTVKLWNVDTGALLATLEGHSDVVWSVGFSPDGERVASGSEDGTVHLWDVSDGDTGLANVTPIKSFAGHTQGVLAVAFHSNGSLIASGGRDGTVRLWKVDSTAAANATGDGGTLAAYSRQVLSLQFNPDGRLLAVGLLDSPTDTTLKLWDIRTRRELSSFDTKTKHDVAFSPDLAQLAVAGASDGTITVWNSIRSVPVLLQPQAGVYVEGTQVTLRWEAVEHSIFYDVEISRTPDFRQVSQSATVTENRLRFEMNKNVPSYWWRVRTGSLGGVSQWSDARAFLQTLPCTVRIVPARRRVNLGAEFAVEVFVEAITDLKVFQFDLHWTSPDVLTFVTVTRFRDIFGESGQGQQPPNPPDQNNGIYKNVSATTADASGVSGSGVLLEVLFRARNTGVSDIQLDNLFLFDSNGEQIHCNLHPSRIVVESPVRPWDVNRDGVVDVSDLSIVARFLGRAAPTDVDVYPDTNADGVVDIFDFTLVGSHFGQSYVADEPETAAPAPSLTIDSHQLSIINHQPTRQRLERIYADLLLIVDNSLPFVRTRRLLRHLLLSVDPTHNLLLQNYPNPFNPETWIPFHLSSASEVKIDIHDVTGRLIRQLDLGYLAPGRYENRNAAAYWDGTDGRGESVASGVYFYTLTTTSFHATRKMIIAK